MTMHLLNKELLQKFLDARTTRDETTGCLVWQRSVSGGGYARIKAPWGKGTTALHRLVYLVFVGTLREDLEVHHTCGNRRCMEFTHLRALTDLEHKRADRNSMVSRTHCKRGHPLSGDNLSQSALRKGLRLCLQCASLRVKNHVHKDIEAYRTWQNAYRKRKRDEKKAASNPSPPVPTEGDPLNSLVG